MPTEGASQDLLSALRQLRLKLLDLTIRNKLIHFRHSPGRSLQFCEGHAPALFDKLVEGSRGAVVPIVGLPEPHRREWIERNGRLSRPEPLEWARRKGIPTSYDLSAHAGPDGEPQLRALLYADDLARHCRKLEREARLAIEETGANMLFLVLGFLEFPDQQQSERMFLSPLISIPVEFVKREAGGQQHFSLQYTGDEVAENLSLREKLRRDHSLILPESDDDIDVQRYFAGIERVIADKPGFHLRRKTSLCLLSFTNMLLFRDLEPENWQSGDGSNGLVEHPIVRSVFEGLGTPESFDGTSAGAPSEHPVESEPGAAIPLIYDADSSQHSALVDAVALRRNLVIEGPPGTGKSQTITNLIAASLAKGNTVLFVAEKMAALEVVKKRLELAGLEPYVLELHSNKTSKKQVLESLERRLAARAPAPWELPRLLDEAERHRAALRAHEELINRVAHEPLALTLHQVMWRAEKHRLALTSEAGALTQISIADAGTIGRGELERRVEYLGHLAAQFSAIGGDVGPASPFYGFQPGPLIPATERELARTFAEASLWADQFAISGEEHSRLFPGCAEGLTQAEALAQARTLKSLVAAADERWPLDLVPRLFQRDPTGELTRVPVDRLGSQIARYTGLGATVRDGITDEGSGTLSRLQGLRALEGLAQQLGVALGTTSELTRVRDQLQRDRDRLVDSLERIRELCSKFGIPFEATTNKLRQVLKLAELIRLAPESLLDLQTPALVEPGAAGALVALADEQGTWVRLQADLDRTLYTDALPPDPEVAAAVGTLREGRAWYRLLQRRWRAAISLHRRLQRTKQRRPAALRLRDLEEVLRLSRLKARWRSNPTWIRVLGEAPQSDPVPLDEHIELARWNVVFVEAQEPLQPNLIPASDLRPESIRALRRQYAPLEANLTAALDAISSLDAMMRQAHLGNGLRTLDSQLVQLDQFQVLLSEQLTWLARSARADVPLDVVLRACAAAVERQQTAASLHADKELRSLLGPHFAGPDTNVAGLAAVHDLGRKIHALPLDAAVRARLQAANPVEVARPLITNLESVAHGLGRALALGQNLSCQGEFSLERWAGASPNESVHRFAAGLSARLRIALDHVRQLTPWSVYVSRRKEALELGLGDFVDLLESKRIAPHELGHAYAYCTYSTIVRSAFWNHQELARFSGLKHTRIRDEYRRLDRKIIELRGAAVAADCRARARPPVGTNGARVGDKTEMRLIDYLIPQQRPRVPVRRLIARAGKAVQALKPCFMMGPQAVAQFLEPGGLTFDLVVMDEASQLRPEEAMGAIARGGQLVVVGDPKQLPPTSFFSRSSQPGEDEDQFATADAESILDVCSSHFQPRRSLRWHYRSQHHSLIAFSNQHFYSKNLIIFPSPYDQSAHLGVKATYLADALYENQVNLKEAQRVVEAVLDHIQNRPNSSLGVVTLNIKQRDLIAELLEGRLRDLDAADEFRDRWAKEGQAPFVKNLENVQGDERDSIIISTTFGKAPGTNVVRQNFGPISRQGGWRRLNVLFTRARQSVAVFTSLRPEDIVVDADTPDGTKALRNYLEYAKSGNIVVPEDTGREPESDFESAVIGVLNSRGYDVTPQLGVTGYRIDIAVKHPDVPGAYLAAIECDGATYHSAVTVRDRDRIRQEILESLGWRDRIWRIWSTDWFRAPQDEIEKLFAFLDQLRRTWRPQHSSVSSWTEEGGLAQTVEDDTAREIESREVVQQALLPNDEDLEVEIGDFVRYVDLTKPDDVLGVRIIRDGSAPGDGVIAAGVPLAQALLGAIVGDEVSMHVPGAPRRTFRVAEIKRPSSLRAN